MPSFTVVPRTLPTRAPMLLLGDSTTYGSGNGGLSYRQALMKLLRPPYYVDFVGPYQSVASPTTEVDQDHAGLSGDFLSNMVTRVVTNIAVYHPKIVLLMGGINDLATGVSGSGCLTLLESVLAAIYGADPTIVTIVAQIPFEGVPFYLVDAVAYNAGIPTSVATRVAAGQYVSYVDNHTGITTGDGIHPDAASYTEIANRWYAGLLAYAPALAALEAAS